LDKGILMSKQLVRHIRTNERLRTRVRDLEAQLAQAKQELAAAESVLARAQNEMRRSQRPAPRPAHEFIRS
jgi:cell division septum initiation protein DivIVA